jgi:hypothetical protein
MFLLQREIQRKGEGGEEVSRTYKTPDGNYDSVTTILGIISKNLLDWAANNQFTVDKDKFWEAYTGLTQFEDRKHFDDFMAPLKGKYREVSKTAMDLGSLCHSMVDCWNTGMFDGSSFNYLAFLSDYYSDDSIKMLGAYFRAINENNIKVLKSEMMVYHTPVGYAGTLDAVVKFDDALMIMDIKTGGVYWSYWLQLEAYRRAYTWMKKEEPVGRMIIRIDKDNPGEYEVLIRPLELNTQIRIWRDRRKKGNDYARDIQHFPCDHEEDWSAFKAAKTLFERSKQK